MSDLAPPATISSARSGQFCSLRPTVVVVIATPFAGGAQTSVAKTAARYSRRTNKPANCCCCCCWPKKPSRLINFVPVGLELELELGLELNLGASTQVGAWRQTNSAHAPRGALISQPARQANEPANKARLHTLFSRVLALGFICSALAALVVVVVVVWSWQQTN